jgi:hypothetical protein
VVRARIAETQRRHWNDREAAGEITGWGNQPSTYRRLVQPHISELSARRLAQATGLSPGYCAQIRSGNRIPHPRHWAALQLAGLSAVSDQ